MKKNKIIFHVDMNAFFCSCEEIRKPYLKNKPFAIGNPYYNKGVISTSNYIARKFNVFSAQSQIEALKKCPNLIIVPHDMKYYQEMSYKFMNFLSQYTNKILQGSIDEAYLDMTQYSNFLDKAKEIQEKLLKEIKLPCSIGISYTIFLAKIASDIKKPLGITFVNENNLNKIYDLDIKKIFGIGKKTYPILYKYNIKKVIDLMNSEELIIKNKLLSKENYDEIIKKLKGESNDIIDPEKYKNPKSIGVSQTFNTNLFLEEDLKKELRNISLELFERLEIKTGKTLTITIKYSNFVQKTKSKTINKNFDNLNIIREYSNILFDELWNGNEVRLLGLSISNFIDKSEKNLFNIDNKLDDAIINLQKKYGNKIIKKGIKN